MTEFNESPSETTLPGDTGSDLSSADLGAVANSDSNANADQNEPVAPETETELSEQTAEDSEADTADDSAEEVSTADEQAANENESDADPSSDETDEAPGEQSEEEPKEQPKEDHAKEAPAKEEPKEQMLWYILKVQVNREDVIRKQLERRVEMAGLKDLFEDFLVPTEKVISVAKNGQKRVTKRKLYPGYIMVKMIINDDSWYLIRETSGVGDFAGSDGRPVPMLAHEVQRVLMSEKADLEEAPKVKVPYNKGDRVKIADGNFKGVEGEVDAIDYNTGRVTVNIIFFQRNTPVDLEYWQVEKVED